MFNVEKGMIKQVQEEYETENKAGASKHQHTVNNTVNMRMVLGCSGWGGGGVTNIYQSHSQSLLFMWLQALSLSVSKSLCIFRH